MPRCLISALAALALVVPALVSIPVQAQIVRPIPLKSLRGELAFGLPPEVVLNGQPVRLSPGARIKDANNMQIMSGAMVGQKLIANYSVDNYGLLVDVWLLRDDEIARPWPKTSEEAAKWSYDPVNHAWIKP